MNNKVDSDKTLDYLENGDKIKQMENAALTAGLLEESGGTSWMQKLNGTRLSDRLFTGIVNSSDLVA